MVAKRIRSNRVWQKCRFNDNKEMYIMRNWTYPVFIMLLLVGAMVYGLVGSVSVADTEAEEGLEKELLRHVVMFRFKPETTQEEIDHVMATLRNLPEAIPEVKDFEWGLETSGRDMNDDYTHLALFTYESKEDLQTYLDHPVHVEAAEIIGEYVESTFIFDYWAQD